jgi:hypothetical protein
MKLQMQQNLQHPTKIKPPSKIKIKQQGANRLIDSIHYLIMAILFATASHKLIN